MQDKGNIDKKHNTLCCISNYFKLFQRVPNFKYTILTYNSEADGVLVISITGSQPVDDGARFGVGRQQDRPHVGTEVQHRLRTTFSNGNMKYIN